MTALAAISTATTAISAATDPEMIHAQRMEMIPAAIMT